MRSCAARALLPVPARTVPAAGGVRAAILGAAATRARQLATVPLATTAPATPPTPPTFVPPGEAFTTAPPPLPTEPAMVSAPPSEPPTAPLTAPTPTPALTESPPPSSAPPSDASAAHLGLPAAPVVSGGSCGGGHGRGGGGSSGSGDGGFAFILATLLGSVAAGVLLAIPWLGASFIALALWAALKAAFTAASGPERVKRRLLAGPADSELLPRGALAAAPPPVLTDTLPVVLTGPAGCGKSTLASELARSLRDRGVPVLYVRLIDDGCDAAAAADADGAALAPLRRMSALVDAACTALTGGGAAWRSSYPGSSECAQQLGAAMTAAFDGCRALAPAPGCGGGGGGAHVPVIIVDGLFNLVSDEGLARRGGREAFAHFTRLVAQHCLTDGAVRVVVAADSPAPVATSSYDANDLAPQLPTWLSARVITVGDTTPADARRQLRHRGYSDADVDAIVGTCGTRAALLAPFLHAAPKAAAAKSGSARTTLAASSAGAPVGGGNVDVAARLAAVRRVAAWRVSQLFYAEPALQRATPEVVSLLDAAVAAEPDATAATAASTPPPHTPPQFYKPAFRQVLYVGADGALRMQSEPLRAAWTELRHRYVRAS